MSLRVWSYRSRSLIESGLDSPISFTRLVNGVQIGFEVLIYMKTFEDKSSSNLYSFIQLTLTTSLFLVAGPNIDPG